jgi:hypothetical protein
MHENIAEKQNENEELKSTYDEKKKELQDLLD